MSIKLPRTAFQLIAGNLTRWQRPTDRGGINRAHYCPDCGVRIFHDAGDEATMVSLKAGSLDDARDLRPVGHIWTDRALPWVIFEPHTLSYPGQPDDYGALIDAWRQAQQTVQVPS